MFIINKKVITQGLKVMWGAPVLCTRGQGGEGGEVWQVCFSHEWCGRVSGYDIRRTFRVDEPAVITASNSASWYISVQGT